jgi:cytochrome oxidase Cu insertion factor (SCO1/SenC/PrrC family)
MRGSRVTVRTATLAILLSATIGVAVGVGIHLLGAGGNARSRETLSGLRGQATWPAGARPAPDFALPDQNGLRTSPASLRGQNVVLAFLGSRCRRACAREPRSLGTALRLLPRSARPVLVVVSVDPRHDTPRSARAAVRRLGLTAAASWHWLLGSRTELAPVWRSYRIAVHRASGHVASTPAVYLIDRRGFERAGLLWPFPPAWPAGDLRILAHES